MWNKNLILIHKYWVKQVLEAKKHDSDKADTFQTMFKTLVNLLETSISIIKLVTKTCA